jgi:hypothetical protein
MSSKQRRHFTAEQKLAIVNVTWPTRSRTDSRLRTLRQLLEKARESLSDDNGSPMSFFWCS